MTYPRSDSETFLLTQASDIENTAYLVIMVGKSDGTFIQHVANFEEISWAVLLGRMEITKHEILTNRVTLAASTADGELLETEDDNETED